MGFLDPVRRKRTPTVASTWKRLEKLFAHLAPAVRKDLNRPSKKRPISALEKALNRTLPNDVKESLLCHDGQADEAGGCIFGNRLLPVSSILAEWEFSRVVDLDAVPNEQIESWPKGAVQLCDLHPGWIPLAADWSGNYIGVDLAPDLRGSRGQIIVFGSHEILHYVIADSWGGFLMHYADDLEAGNYEVHLDDNGIPDFCYYKGDTIEAIGKQVRSSKS